MKQTTTLGVIVGNRGFFPAHLCETGRKEILAALKREGIDAVILDPDATKFGAVESYDDARKCADLFRANRDTIDGVLVTLPNFGDERAVADTLRLSGLTVPVLVHAFDDEKDKMTIKFRRDSFCGKMSACNNLRQYGIRYSLTSLHTMSPDSGAVPERSPTVRGNVQDRPEPEERSPGRPRRAPDRVQHGPLQRKAARAFRDLRRDARSVGNTRPRCKDGGQRCARHARRSTRSHRTRR